MNEISEKLGSIIWNVSLSLNSELTEIGAFWIMSLTKMLKRDCATTASLTFSSLEKGWKSI